MRVYLRYMTTLLDEAIEKIRQLPRDQQQMIANLLIEFADQDRDLKLNAVQIAEVRRRLADANPRYASLEHVAGRFGV